MRQISGKESCAIPGAGQGLAPGHRQSLGRRRPIRRDSVHQSFQGRHRRQHRGGVGCRRPRAPG